jgi:hypothetical protein
MTTLNFPPNLPISHILFKQCKLWVWDFDDTLIDTATYYSSKMDTDAILARTDAQLDNEVPQWRYFRQLVEFLVGNGRYVGIASFGTYEIIQAYMKRIMGFNQHFFNKMNIVAPEYKQRNTFRFNQPPNKNEYVYQLMRIYRIQDFKRVVLFDDNATNIADAIGIGIVAVQIPSLNGGDKPTSEKLMFGPWIMADFDKKLEQTCGDELYRNRTYTGIVSKENYTGTAYDIPESLDTSSSNAPRKGDIDFGTGSKSWDGYYMEPYDLTLGVDDSIIYKDKIPAFGTGIGDRKINKRPQFAWNNYRMPRSITPQWWNGNYMNVPGLVKSQGYWDADTLGGASPSYWDKYQSVLKKEQEDEKNENRQVIYPSGGTVESFESNESHELGNSAKTNTNCACGIPPTWLMILLFIVIILIVIVMTKL